MLKREYIIKTERLELRCFTINDLDDMTEYRSNPKNNPFAPEDIWRSEHDAKDFYDFATLFYDDNPNQPNWFRYFFAIRELGDEKVIGFCGIGAPDFDRISTEVFYGLVNTKWNKGYATEATKAMLYFGFSEIKLERIIGFINPDNIASRRVLEKSGLKEIGALDNIPQDHDCFGNILFAITHDEYIKRHSKLIFVEGLPGTGKTTFSNHIYNLLTAQSKPVKLFLEDDERIPSNFCNISAVPKNTFQNLYTNETQISDAVLTQSENYVFIKLSKCPEKIAKEFKCWDIGDEYNKAISVHEYVCSTLEWLQNWVKNYSNESILILDSAFMQNPINEMIFRGATNREVESYIHAIVDLMKPLSPVCIYLRRENAEKSILFAKSAKGKEWTEGVDKALVQLNCPDLFERRFKLELSLLSSVINIVCDVNGDDWSVAEQKISECFT